MKFLVDAFELCQRKVPQQWPGVAYGPIGLASPLRDCDVRQASIDQLLDEQHGAEPIGDCTQRSERRVGAIGQYSA